MNDTNNPDDPWWPVRRATIRFQAEVDKGSRPSTAPLVKAVRALARFWNVSLAGVLARCEDHSIFVALLEWYPASSFDGDSLTSDPLRVLSEEPNAWAPPIAPPAWSALTYDLRRDERDVESVIRTWKLTTGREPPVWREPVYNALDEFELAVVRRHVSRGWASKRMRAAVACNSDPRAHLADIDLVDVLREAIDEARRDGVVILERPYRIEEIDLILEVYRSRFMTSHECR